MDGEMPPSAPLAPATHLGRNLVAILVVILVVIVGLFAVGYFRQGGGPAKPGELTDEQKAEIQKALSKPPTTELTTEQKQDIQKALSKPPTTELTDEQKAEIQKALSR